MIYNAFSLCLCVLATCFDTTFLGWTPFNESENRKNRHLSSVLGVFGPELGQEQPLGAQSVGCRVVKLAQAGWLSFEPQPFIIHKHMCPLYTHRYCTLHVTSCHIYECFEAAILLCLKGECQHDEGDCNWLDLHQPRHWAFHFVDS